MDIDTLQKTLYKYKISPVTGDGVNISYNNYGHYFSYLFITRSIMLIKFIHDNLSYIEELILLNGYNKIGELRYAKENIKIYILFHYIVIQTFEGMTMIDEQYLLNQDSLFDKLREHLDAKPKYKPVIKNE